MVPTAFAALIAKDLKLFLSDRRAVILAFAMPVAIGSFFGMLFPGSRSTETQSRIPVLVVDLDTSDISRAMTAALASDKNLSSESTSIEQARDRVRRGNAAVGIVIPQGFGDAAGRAFFSGGEKPQLQLLYDPSRGMELAMVRGLITQHVMESVSREVFTGDRGRKVIDDTIRSLDSAAMPDDQKRLLRDMLESVQRFNAAGNTASTGRTPGITLPYDVREEAMTARQSTNYNGYAHSFAGMGLQFMLMGAINFAIEILVERQRGLWKRLRAAPISKLTLLGSKVGSGTVIGTLVMLVSFGFAILVWGVRIEGSVAGFIGVTIASAADGRLLRAADRRPRQDTQRRARRVGARDVAHGDARRSLGAHVRVSGLATDGHSHHAHALGGRRVRRDDVARLRAERRTAADSRAVGICRRVLAAGARTVPVGGGVGE